MILPRIVTQRGIGIPTVTESLCSSKTLKTRQKKKAREREAITQTRKLHVTTGMSQRSDAKQSPETQKSNP